MGIVKNGLHGEPKGEVGGLIYYQRMGVTVCRMKGVRKKGSSKPQVVNQGQMAIVSKFISKILEFATVGYKAIARKENRIAYNMVTSELKLNGWKVAGSKVVLDFERMVLSKGNLVVPEQVSIETVPTGVEFKWHVDSNMPWAESTDQVMLMAYFPQSKTVLSVLYGSLRAVGSCILPVSTPMLGKKMHTFISFISSDRTDVSNGIYAGNLNL